jgi:hypothetical protein
MEMIPGLRDELLKFLYVRTNSCKKLRCKLINQMSNADDEYPHKITLEHKIEKIELLDNLKHIKIEHSHTIKIEDARSHLLIMIAAIPFYFFCKARYIQR